MVYDQAQSARLGQRVPIESTYVQMVDDENLLEAAYPGMLIYQNSTQQLLIWSDPDQAWASVAGGVAGHLVFVGPDEPTGPNVSLGDTWFETDNNYLGHVWNGTSWQPTGVSASQVTGGTFTQDINLQARLVSRRGPNGERVEMDQDGLRVYGPSGTDGELRTNLDADGSQVFRGGAEIDYLTTTEQLTMRKGANQVSRGGALTLNAGVTAPGTAPSASIGWASAPLTGFDLTGLRTLDLAWDSTLSRWLVPVSGSGVGKMLAYTAAGAYDTTIGTDMAYDPSGGGYVAGARAGGVNYYLWAPGGSTLTLVGNDGSSIDYWPINTSATFSMAADGTDIVIAERLMSGSNAWVELTRYTPGSAAGANLVPNPGFEASLTNWTFGAGVASTSRITGTNKINGTASMQVVMGGVALGFVATSQFVVIPHRKYDFSGLIKRISGPGTASVELEILWFNAVGTTISGTTGVTHTVSSGVTTFAGTAMAPPTAAKARVEVVFPDNAGTYVVDDFNFSATAGTNYTSTDDMQIFSSATAPADGIYIGSGDFGSAHYVVATGTPDGNWAAVAPVSSPFEDKVNKSFPLPQVPRGIGYDGTSFWSLGINDVLYKHESGNNWTSQPTTWYAASTYRDTVNGYHTVLSPYSTFTMKRRARVTISASPINGTGSGDPNEIGYYLARKTSAPTLTDWHFQDDTSASSLLITAANFGSANPDATGNFPSATNSAEMKSAATDGFGELIQFWGDGHWRLGSMSGDTTGAISGAGGGGVVTTAAVHHRRATGGTPNFTSGAADSTYGLGTSQNDVGGISFNTTTREFTVPADGTYLLACESAWDPTGAGNQGRRRSSIAVNGTVVAYRDSQVSQPSLGVSSGTATARSLVTGDKVTFLVFQNSGVTANFNGEVAGNWVSVTKVDGIKGDTGAAGSLTGPAGGDLTGTYPNPTLTTLTFTFAVGSTTWNCTHNLGKVGVKVFCTDSSGSEQRGDVVHTDADHVTIHWVSATTGIAYITP